MEVENSTISQSVALQITKKLVNSKGVGLRGTIHFQRATFNDA